MSYPVDGPFRVAVKSIPAGAALDVDHYLGTIVLQLAHLACEDPQSLIDELTFIGEREHAAPDSPALHERDAAVQRLIDDVTAEEGIPVYGPAVQRLAAALLRTVQPRLLPEQQDRRAS
ncbi:hypothetical protein [Streptomyces sp. NPDC093093]|uniref:hypothetical protein n=1 Tax=Streptomyces sp. NPDC093093 TaxID=3366025 RepID=UPI00381FB101